MAVEKVKYSIERFGFLFPIVADINFVIVCGHIRVRACRELGIQTVPCIIADELTEEQINLFRLIDNKTSEYSD
ncbi:ParB N-terminal domain-containing protein, partial [bacterium]|nr:ParB N-terminal domain-containing protein [bacterium]